MRAILTALFLCCAASGQIELRPVACAGERNLRLLREDAPVTLRFVNATSAELGLHRLDSAGSRVFDSTLPSGGVVLKKTFVTQPWVVTTAAGECRAVYLPVTGEATARITDLSIVLPQTGILFTAVADGPAPPPLRFPVVNGGTGVMNWSVSIPMMTGGMIGGWVRLSPLSGSSDAAQLPPQVEVQVDPLGLPPGEYCNLVEVTAAGAINSPQNFCVVLTVLPADANPEPRVEPGALWFTATAGGTEPEPQVVKVYNLANRPLLLRAAAAANWLSYGPAGGVAEPGVPLSITVQPRTGALKAGSYEAELSLRLGEDGPSIGIPVQALVRAADAGASATGRRAAAAQCTPTRLLPAFAALRPEFSLQAGWPIPVEVLVHDDCANPMATGSVVTTFSNNDPPLYLSSVMPGRWSGTWAARNPTPAGMTISVRAQQPEKNLEGLAQVSGRLQEPSDIPVVAAGGILNAVSFAATPPAPGSYVAIFGERLAEGSEMAADLPLLNRMKGTEVFISGRTVPLLATSAGQVNAMIPFNITVNGRHQLIVRRGHCMSVPEPLEVAAAAPAVFTVDGSGTGQGRIYGITAEGDQVLADPSSPARPGDKVVIYTSGLGAVDPPLEAGTSPPAAPAIRAINPVSVTIGGESAEVLFATLIPGFPGNYQVMATVPVNTAPGDQVPVVLAAGGQSSRPVSMAIRY